MALPCVPHPHGFPAPGAVPLRLFMVRVCLISNRHPGLRCDLSLHWTGHWYVWICLPAHLSVPWGSSQHSLFVDVALREKLITTSGSWCPRSSLWIDPPSRIFRAKMLESQMGKKTVEHNRTEPYIH
jgi:hypothetical protein